MRNMIADDRRRQALVGNHAVLDRVAQVNEANVRREQPSSIFRPGLPLVLLFDNLFVQDVDLPDHQEAQIADEVGSQVIVGYCVNIDVEAKPLALKSAPIRKLHGEIKGDALIRHSTSFHEASD